MSVLGIDSSAGTGSVGVCDGEQILGEYSFTARRSQSEKLLPAIDTLLSGLEIEKQDLEKIVAVTGPGSFTGLRIGLSTAKGLSLSLDIPLIGVPLTEVYYDRVGFYPGPVCTVIADRRDLVYYACFEKGRKQVDERSTPLDELKSEVSEKFGGREMPVLFVGDGLNRHRDFFEGISFGVLARGRANYPSAAQAAIIGSSKEGNQVHDIEPLYAQRPKAERAMEG